jgi:subtilisin family serine protease
MVNYITDENYLDIMIENALLDLYKDMPVTYLNLRNSMVHIKIDDFDECLLGTYPYYSLPTCYILESNPDLDATGVTKVQRSPEFGLFGNGVLVGIVDTGIEYTHEAFRYQDGNTRIASIWDQTIEDSTRVPVGFFYGAEYTQQDINEALKLSNPLKAVPSVDENGHGTMIAGAMAGSIMPSQQFQGVVPQAELVVVKCKPAKKYNRKVFMIKEDILCYQETDIMMGIRYIREFAQKQNKPVSLCLAIGSSQEGHDGYNALSRYTDYMTQLPRYCITIAAGNEGNSKRHFYGSYTSLNAYVDFEMNVDKQDSQFTLEIWQQAPNRFAVQIFTPSGESTEIVYPRVNECNKFNFIFVATKLWINNDIVEVETGQQLAVIRFENADIGVWRIRVYNVDNSNAYFHAWLPAGEMISKNTFFLNPNPNTTITSPGNSVLAITVTAYSSKDNSIWTEASRGYSSIGIVLPDISAPGVNIMCPILKNGYGTATGTGMAAAITAGIVAMIQEWAVVKGKYPTINGADIKQFIIRGAVRDSGGDVQRAYPNPVWGYGKINISEIFNKIQ